MSERSLTLQHLLRIRLARDDLERMVSVLPDDTFDEAVKGCTVKVLLEEENQARVYRIAWITGVDVANTPYRFGAHINTSKTLILDFSIFKMSYQMNTISNSPFNEEEFRQWIRSSDNKPPISAERAEAKANALQLVWDQYPDATPGRPWPSQAAAPGGRRRDDQGAAGGPPQTLLRTGVQRGGAPPPSSQIGEGELSSAMTELLEKFFVQHVRLTSEQKQLLTVFAQTCDAHVALQKQRMNHQLRRAQQANAAGAAANAVQQGEGDKGTVSVAGNLENMNVVELKEVLANLERVRKEVQEKVDEKGKCVICFVVDASTLLLPCKHQVMCTGCAAKVSECPVCRVKIQDRVEPYRP